MVYHCILCWKFFNFISCFILKSDSSDTAYLILILIWCNQYLIWCNQIVSCSITKTSVNVKSGNIAVIVQVCCQITGKLPSWEGPQTVFVRWSCLNPPNCFFTSARLTKFTLVLGFGEHTPNGKIRRSVFWQKSRARGTLDNKERELRASQFKFGSGRGTTGWNFSQN